MFETHEYKRMWWLAADPDKKLAGTLAVRNGKAELEVLGNFGAGLTPKDGSIVFDFSEPDIPSRVIGRSAMKEDITLEGAPISRWPADISTYDPPWVLVGKAFAEDDEIAFDEMVIRITDLDTWACVSGFRKPEAGAGAFDIRFERPPAIPIPLDGDEHAQIEFWPSHSGWRHVTTSVTISQTTALRLRFAKRHSLNQVAERVRQFRNLLCLAVGRPVSVLSVTVFQDDYQRSDSTHPLPIELLWQIPHNPDPPTEPRHAFQMPFTLPEAPQGIAEVLNAWFAMEARYQPVFNLYFGMRYHPDMYGDIRFLAYAQAAETFHLRQSGKKQTLDKRIRALLDECPTVSSQILRAAAVELEDFVSAFKDSRNYYTHYDPKKERKAATGVPLYVLTVQLQAIIEMSLLRELGFSCEQIDTIFTTRVQRYAEIANAKTYADDEDEAVPKE